MSVASPGTVSWFEIGTTDAEDVTRFYGGLFGWTFEPRSADYTEIVARDGTRPMGGICTPGDELSPAILAHDVAEALGKIQLAGAAVVTPAKAADVPGREGIVYARLRDPLGNAFTLYFDDRPHPPEIVDGGLAGFELGTTEVDATKEFYFECFGWTFELDPAAPGSFYHVLGQDRRRIGGLADHGLYGDDYLMPLFHVTDGQGTVEKARSLGATLESDRDDPRRRLVDPRGNRFGLSTG
ncbi:VOC family protein [Nonomuraea antimicrobica]|uniref:VOC family protein n=1 Tax=Nonomuraea antimicrobica TaxID=561173 RepID=A0ABP7B2Q5_9ACTN